MKRAIALCGGGSKGAYELGAWKALKEKGIEYHIVTGTSIGAINGALMASKDYDLALEMWNTIRMEDIIADGINLTTAMEGMYNQKEMLSSFFKKYLKNKGADISPFIEFIDKMVDEEKVRASHIDYGLVTVQVPSIKALELTKEKIPQGKLKDFIMASASIFPIFPLHKIDGELYLDGCYYDNLPIDLALKMGADEVIAIDLHTSPSHPNYVNKPYVTYITPARSLGNMLNFERQVLKDNIDLGYYDTMKALGCMTGKKYQFYIEDLKDYKTSIWNFTAQAAKIEAYITDGVFHRFVKVGEGKKLCSNIEAHIEKREGKYTREDYFIGAAEICGEIFKISEKKPWHIKEFIQEILGKMKSRDFYPDVSIFNGKVNMEILVKFAELKSHTDREYITGCIYYAYKEGKIDITQQLGLLASCSYELAAVLFLLAVKNNKSNTPQQATGHDLACSFRPKGRGI